MMKDVSRIKSLLSELFKDRYFTVLATRSGDELHTALVAFAAALDLKTIFLCTPRTTRKYKNLLQNPQVSLLIHNSGNLPADIRQSVAVSVTGRAFEVGGMELEPARALYLSKNPHMTPFVSSPDTAVMGVQVDRYDVVEQFQNVTILDIQDACIVHSPHAGSRCREIP